MTVWERFYFSIFRTVLTIIHCRPSHRYAVYFHAAESIRSNDTKCSRSNEFRQSTKLMLLLSNGMEIDVQLYNVGCVGVWACDNSSIYAIDCKQQTLIHSKLSFYTGILVEFISVSPQITNSKRFGRLICQQCKQIQGNKWLNTV